MSQARMYNVIQPEFSARDREILDAIETLVGDGVETSEAIDTIAAEMDTGRNGRIALYAHFGIAI